MKRKILIVGIVAGTLFASSLVNAQTAPPNKNKSKKQSTPNAVVQPDSIQNQNNTVPASTIYPAGVDSTQTATAPAPTPAPAPKQNLNIQRGINFGNHTGMGSDTSATTKEKSPY